MSTRRKTSPPTANGGLDSTTSTASTPPKPAPAATTMNARSTADSPYLPTALERILIGLYPSTLLLGSLFSLLSPQTRLAPYDAFTQSHPFALAPSYFAQKTNVFNVYFVKVGWFWTTLALAAFLLTHPGLGPTPRTARAVLRWGVATLWWVGVTQWFFGPALIDRGFSLTGGACEAVGVVGDEVRVSEEARLVVTGRACKAAGGRWLGGHDMSGHVFLLILGSGLLWFEVLPVVLSAVGGLGGRRVIALDNGGVGTVADVDVARAGPGAAKKETGMGMDGAPGLAVKFALGVAGLSWWMLLMTAAYFHTWPEKLSGLLVAFAALWSIYFIPRAVPLIRHVIGMPAL